MNRKQVLSCMPRRRRRRDDGMVIIFVVVLIAALAGFCSLAVDYGRVQTAKVELQRTADAAARAAVQELSAGGGVSAAEDAAVAIAAANDADGSATVLDPSTDIQFVQWDDEDHDYTTLSGAARADANAIRIIARRDDLSLVFGPLIGMNSVNVHAVSIARATDGLTSGFMGIDSFYVKNNLYVYSYDSSVTASPSSSNHQSHGMIGSNGSITAKNNEVVGTVILGPSGTHNLSLDTPATVLTEELPTPTTDFSGAPATNPGGVSKNLSVSGTTTLNAGAYYFTSITIANNGLLTFSGPATVYVNGSVTFSNNGEIRAYNKIPGNLTIRQKGSSSTFGGSGANGVTVYADIEAPQTAFSAKNNVKFYGRALFKSIYAKNNAEFYYDEALRATIEGIGGGSIATVY